MPTHERSRGIPNARSDNRLKAMGVPFWLATGYGEMAEKQEEMGASGLLVKPYGREELAQSRTEFERKG